MRKALETLGLKGITILEDCDVFDDIIDCSMKIKPSSARIENSTIPFLIRNRPRACQNELVRSSQSKTRRLIALL